MIGDLELTDPERLVVDHAAAGAETDFLQVGDDCRDGGNWGSQRVLRAEVLAGLLTERPDDGHQLRKLDISGARITGRLALEALSLLRPLRLSQCYFEEPVDLNSADASRIDLEGSRVPELYARGLQTSGDVHLASIWDTTVVRMAGARIGGSLTLAGAKIGSEDGTVAFDGDSLTVAHHLDARELHALGMVALTDASIGGSVGLGGASLLDPEGAGLLAERLKIGGGLFCSTGTEERFEVKGEMRLVGAVIGGQAFLAGARLNNPGGYALQAEGMRCGETLYGVEDDHGRRLEVDGTLGLAGAHIGGSLELTGARLTSKNDIALHGDQLRVDKSVLCTSVDDLRFEVDGEIRLVGATIGGSVALTGARLSNPEGVTLNADQLRADGGLYCDSEDGGARFESEGCARLPDLDLRGALHLSGARFSNPGGVALMGDRLRASQGVFGHCDGDRRRLEVHGVLRLPGARIDGQLCLDGALLSNAGATALNGSGLEVATDLLLQSDGREHRFEVDGLLDLSDARIGGDVILAGARVSNPGRDTALDGSGMRIGASPRGVYDARWRRFTIDGVLRLGSARVEGNIELGKAAIRDRRWGLLDLNRCRAQRLSLPERLTADDRVNLTHAAVFELCDEPAGPRVLDEDEDYEELDAVATKGGYSAYILGFTYETLGESSADCTARLAWLNRAQEGYVPGAYDQLAAVYRRAGDDASAKQTMIAKYRRRREALGPLGRAANIAFETSIGYGYRTSRAIAALLAIVLVGWPVFALAYPAHMVATRPTNELPAFHGLLYSLDAVLPVVSLGQEAAWTPHGAIQAWYAFSILSGWLLGLGLVAFLTSQFFRE
jgi:hypothetical protein